MLLTFFFIAVFGLITGSFLNAVIYRLHEKKSFLAGRSFCPHCQHHLAVKDLIPIFSYLFLGGKCRYCQKPISPHYPLVEGTTALAFCLLYAYFSLSLAFIFYLILSCFLIIIFVYDLKHHLILDKVSLPAVVLAFIFSLILKISVVDILLGGLIGGGFFLLQFVFSRGKWIGGGDIRLGLLMGFILGWKKLLVALFLAYLAGSLVAVLLLITRKKSLKSRLAFGTFLSLFTFIAILWGDLVLEWYLSGHLINWLYQ